MFQSAHEARKHFRADAADLWKKREAVETQSKIGDAEGGRIAQGFESNPQRR
jgi:hypothetical protein